ncbi:hypothetical protein [Sorangium sp. So ce385]|uniref:hypothetical protein n=1 Tax=Sorangium sp. So ce385 TaxID=3133308 RepID=UPI003F5B1D18
MLFIASGSRAKSYTRAGSAFIVAFVIGSDGAARSAQSTFTLHVIHQFMGTIMYAAKATKIRIAGIATLAVGLAIGASALADSHSIAGSNCRVRGSGGIAEVSPQGVISNAGTTTLSLSCPVDRGFDGPNGGMFARVYAHDHSTTANVCCSASLVNPTDGSTSSVVSGCTSGTGLYQSIGLTVPSGTGSSSDYINLQCTVPGTTGGLQSAVIAYKGYMQ